MAGSDDAVREATRNEVRAGALAAARRLLGAGRERDAQAFADLVLARFDEIDEEFRELMEIAPSEVGSSAAVRAAWDRVMTAAQTNICTIAVESLRIALYGDERGRQQ
jgi:hypothetical protein